MLYSLPIGASKIPELDALQKKVGENATIRLMVDNAEQIRLLQSFNEKNGRKEKWSVFVKVDGGGR